MKYISNGTIIENLIPKLNFRSYMNNARIFIDKEP